MKLILGYERVKHFDCVLYVPDLTKIDPKTKRTVYLEPVGGKERPFTLLLKPLRDDTVRIAFDAYLDGVAQYFADHAPETPGELRTPETMIRTADGRALHRDMVIAVVMAACVGWKNADAVGEDGEPIEDAPYSPDALREAFEQEIGLAEQAFVALTDIRSGKQVRLTRG